MTTTPIFHLALPEQWAAAVAVGLYTQSTRDRTLDDEGFIHCSTAEQVDGVATRFYADLDELILLTIDPAAVGCEVRYEPPAAGVDELFPHIYGPLPIGAVRSATVWRHPPQKSTS